ncbi:MAG: histidine phosphatase family protein [Oleiphilus sp.]
MYTETIIDLIRHGEPEGGHKLRGSLDDPLSQLGWEQMQRSVQYTQPWQAIITSPLSRCQTFASTLSSRLQLPLEINEQFKEIHFGIWEGLKIKELMQKEPLALKNYWQNPSEHAPKDSEPMDDFLSRIHLAWQSLIKQQEGQHSLLVCHGGVIRAIIMHVLGMPKEHLWNVDVPYANASRLVYHHFQDGTFTAQLKFHQAYFPEA